MYKILVLLASHNGEKFLKKQIDSIFNQKKCLVHLIVSDDCSKDKTIDLLRKLKNKYKNMQIIENKTKFNNFSENFYNLILNANESSYDFIALSDQDDIFKKDKFYTQINEIHNTDFAACSCSVKCFQGSTRLLVQSEKINKYDFLFEGAGQGCTFLIKKELFIKVKKFIKNNFSIIKNFVFHDWLIYIYARGNNHRWRFLRLPLVKYRIHSNNEFGNKYSISGLKKRIILLQNNWYFDQVNLAHQIYKIINPNHTTLSQLTFINSLKFSLLYARRKYTDRLIFVFFYFLYRIKGFK